MCGELTAVSFSFPLSTYLCFASAVVQMAQDQCADLWYKYSHISNTDQRNCMNRIHIANAKALFRPDCSPSSTAAYMVWLPLLVLLLPPPP